MKLRIRGNSVRLRLLRSEVAELEENGVVSESCVFGPDTELVFSVRVTETDALGASFTEREITVEIPEKLATEWFETELVGFDAKIPNGKDGLSVLIEKDFVCLTRTDDPDNLDAYPNPEEENC